MKRAFATAAIAALLLAPAVVHADADAIVGRWYTENDESQVEIYKVEKNGVTTYHGKLVWFENPVYEADDPEAGVTLHDRHNPDESLRQVPLLGLNMLKDFVYDADAQEWNDGTIYDPEKGKTYNCVMTLGEGDKLDVRGYVGIPALGRTTQWVRVTEANDKMEKSKE